MNKMADKFYGDSKVYRTGYPKCPACKQISARLTICWRTIYYFKSKTQCHNCSYKYDFVISRDKEVAWRIYEPSKWYQKSGAWSGC